MHHVLLRSGLDILVAHILNGLLLRTQFVLEDLKFDSVLGNGRLLLIQIALQLLHLIPDTILVSLKEANFLRVELVILALVFYRLRSPIKGLSLHGESLDLLLQLIVQVGYLKLFFLKFSLHLLESALFHCQVATIVLCELKLFA